MYEAKLKAEAESKQAKAKAAAEKRKLKKASAGEQNSVSAVKKKTDKVEARGKKDPDAPKRAKTAYNYFTSDMRNVVASEMAGASPADILSAIAAKWNAVDEVLRAKYEAMALVDKKRYEHIS
jgi:structure-specific recognition protein 1